MHAMEGTVEILSQAPTVQPSLASGLRTGLLSKYMMVVLNFVILLTGYYFFLTKKMEVSSRTEITSIIFLKWTITF